MDSHGVPTAIPATMTIGGITFDRVVYDREGDVLYLHVGDPASAVDFDGTAEGDGTSYGPDGSLVGISILNARLRLEQDGETWKERPFQSVSRNQAGTSSPPRWSASIVVGSKTSRPRSSTS